MQEAIHREFMYLIKKMLSSNKQLDKADAQASIDYGGRR
jgi:hypothetical protein